MRNWSSADASAAPLVKPLRPRASGWKWTPAIGMVLFLAGCESPQTGDPTELDQPIFGANRETKFYMAPTGGVLKLRDVVAVAKVIRRYKTLDAAEQALVKLAVRRNINALIALEARKIEARPEIQAERRRIQASADKAAARQASAELEARILRMAAAKVADDLANLVAVPMKSAENRSIVAFAKVTPGGDVQVASAAYEVDAPPGAVGTGTKVPLPAEGAVALGASRGADATVVSAPEVTVKPPRL